MRYISLLLQYNLETCTEKRTAVWIHEPYTGIRHL